MWRLPRFLNEAPSRPSYPVDVGDLDQTSPQFPVCPSTWGGPPDIERLSNGRLVVPYNERETPEHAVWCDDSHWGRCVIRRWFSGAPTRCGVCTYPTEPGLVPFLDVDPSVSCWEGDHWLVAVWFVVGVVIDVVVAALCWLPHVQTWKFNTEKRSDNKLQFDESVERQSWTLGLFIRERSRNRKLVFGTHLGCSCILHLGKWY